jgi:glutamate/tyrosine decarboxylase-like PLP-dependent enzyme
VLRAHRSGVWIALRQGLVAGMSLPVSAAFEEESLLRAALQHALAYRRSLPTRAVAASATTETIGHALAALGRLPIEGCGAPEVLEELVRIAEPGVTAMSGPRFFGWVTGGTLAAALAADWMTSAWDQNAGPAAGAPAANAFELAAIGWVIELLELPDETRGALTTGATMANFTALAAARHHVLAAAKWDVEKDGLFGAPKVRVLVGQERHDTIDKALRLLGFGKRAMCVVDSDGQGRMLPAALRRELVSSKGPVIVCAQAGNVNSGAFDPLTDLHDALADYRQRQGAEHAWLHVDGAFGLWARAAAATRELAAGTELCDSWTIDAHKFLNVPYDSGIVLTRHPRAHRRTMAVHGAYLSSGSEVEATTPGAFAPELSRRARGFVLWAALRQLGRSGLDRLVTRSAELARLLGSELEKTPGLAVLNDIAFNQVVMRATPPSGVPALDFTRDLVLAIQAEGTCYATPTIWRGVPAVRFSIINAATSADDIIGSALAVGRVYTASTAAAALVKSGEERPTAR